MASKAAELLLRIKTAGEESLESLQDNLKAVGEIGVAAFTALSAIVVKSLHAYAEAEEASNSLTRSMVNAGVYSRDLRQAYDDQAKALSGLTTFEDDQITAAQAALQMQLREIPISKELMTATLDLAQAKKIDLVSAAELVGKTIGTSTNALARQGIEVSATTDKHKRLAEVIQQVNSHMGGQAVAAAQGLGVFKQLEHSIGNLFEALGERLAPAFGVIGHWLNSLANDAAKTTGSMDFFVQVIHMIVNAGVMAAATMDVLGLKLGGTLATAFEAISQAAHGHFKQALETTTSGMKDIDDATHARTKLMHDQLAELDKAFGEKQKGALEKEEQDLTESLRHKKEIRQIAHAEQANIELEQMMTDKTLALAMIDASEGEKVSALMAWNDKKLALAVSAEEKNALMRQKYSLMERQEEIKLAEFKKKQDEETAKNRGDTLNKIATLSSSSNKELAAIGKAAAITQIAIETPVAIAKALSAFPPPFNFAAAGLVGVAMAAQASQIAGVQLAEGGIVRARPGGIQATIGEGGQDEAVIPLDRAGDFGLGGGKGSNVTIIVNGGMLGSESEAREFARAVDKELLKLRQNNESVAFDSGVV